MPTWKVAYFSGVGGRPQIMLENAPEDIEVAVVDPALPEAEKIDLCRDADAIISSDLSLSLVQECSRLKLIQTLSAGYDRLPLEEILEMGIPVANNGGANAISVSEQTLALMIGISRNLMAQWDSTTRQRAWRSNLYQTDLSEVTDKTVGIIGLGRIGRQVAKRLTGFDTRTIFYDIEDIPEDVQREVKAEPVAVRRAAGDLRHREHARAADPAHPGDDVRPRVRHDEAHGVLSSTYAGVRWWTRPPSTAP